MVAFTQSIQFLAYIERSLDTGVYLVQDQLDETRYWAVSCSGMGGREDAVEPGRVQRTACSAHPLCAPLEARHYSLQQVSQ